MGSLGGALGRLRGSSFKGFGFNVWFSCFSRKCTPPKREACFLVSDVPSCGQRCVDNQVKIKLGAYKMAEAGYEVSRKSA